MKRPLHFFDSCPCIATALYQTPLSSMQWTDPLSVSAFRRRRRKNSEGGIKRGERGRRTRREAITVAFCTSSRVALCTSSPVALCTSSPSTAVAAVLPPSSALSCLKRREAICTLFCKLQNNILVSRLFHSAGLQK